MNTARIPSLSELRWRCRRGMLELDIMLNAYLDKEGAKMTTNELSMFEKLLAYPDQVLYGLLLGVAESADADIISMVDGIRQVVKQQRGVTAQSV